MNRTVIWGLSAVVLAALYISSRYSFVLFHTVAELFSIVIGLGMFVLTWNCRGAARQSGWLSLLGLAYAAVAVLDMCHTLSYKGVQIIPGSDANTATQYWIAARLAESLSLCFAPLFLKRRLNIGGAVFGYVAVTAMGILAISAWRVFPVCFVEGAGLTTFKRVAEYAVCLLVAGSAWMFWARRREIDQEVLRLVLGAVALRIISELAFTTYVGVFDAANAAGHLLKIVSFYLLYRAIIEIGISRPYALLLRESKESEERYKLLFDQNPDGVFATDVHGRFTDVNPACERISGYSAAELMRMTFTDLCAPDQLQKTLESFQRNLSSQIYSELETALVRKDGRRVELWIAGKPIASGGKLVAIHCTVKDITDRKKMERQLLEAQESLHRHADALEETVQQRTAKLQEIVGELEHFSYTITHDMRAPLRAMTGYAELVEEGCHSCQSGEQRKLLARIKTAARRMDALIVDALSYSHAVRQELTLRPVDANELLQGMIESYPEFHSDRANIRLHGSIPPLMANEAALIQCFSNLLGNAVKFVRAGEIADVQIRAERRDGWVRVWVEDKGIGIPASILPRVFEMFTRGNKEYEGTGIGLALVRKVVQRMGGRLGVESETGRGSRFWLELRAADKEPFGCGSKVAASFHR